jgi:hypothetical protein
VTSRVGFALVQEISKKRHHKGGRGVRCRSRRFAWPTGFHGYMLRARAVVMAVTMQRLAAVRVGVPRVVYGVRSAKVSQKRGLVHGHLAQRPWVSPELGFGFARPRTRWFAAVAEGGVEGVAEGVAEGVHGVESGVDSVASGVLGVQDKSSSEPTPPAKYQPPPGNYAGAGATVHHDDVHLGDSGHVVLVDGMSVIFRSFYGWQARGAPLLDSNGVDISVLYSVAHAVLAVLELPRYVLRVSQIQTLFGPITLPCSLIHMARKTDTLFYLS